MFKLINTHFTALQCPSLIGLNCCSQCEHFALFSSLHLITPNDLESEFKQDKLVCK